MWQRRFGETSFVILVSLFMLLGVELANAQQFNRPTPPSYPRYEFQRSDTTSLGAYYLVTPMRKDGATGTTKGLGIIDEDGYLAWWSANPVKHFDFKYHADRQQYSFCRRSGSLYIHFFLDDQFNIVDSLHVPTPYFGDVHETLVLSNGNRCLISREYVVMDLSSYTFNGVPGSASTVVIDFVLLEFDAADNLVFEWKGRDHLPITMYVDDYPYQITAFDYLHANAIEETQSGDLLVSFRNADAIIKIDRTTEQVAWIFGGNHNQFTLQNDSGFSGQHDVRELPDGSISIFDNAFWANTGGRGVSYQIDEQNLTATKVYEYQHPLNGPAKTMGSFRTLDNGYRILGWGNNSRPFPSLTLVDEVDNIAAELFFEDTVISYRAFFETLPNLPPRPAITCSFDGVNYVLSAPSAAYYLWSTGENTQSITVADTGAYVVWVSQGIGLMGSHPFHVFDVQNACSTVSLDEATTDHPASEVVGYYDLLGRSVRVPIRGQLYLIRYADGRVKKAFSGQ